MSSQSLPWDDFLIWRITVKRYMPPSLGHRIVQSLQGDISEDYDGGLPTEPTFKLWQDTNLISQREQLQEFIMVQNRKVMLDLIFGGISKSWPQNCSESTRRYLQKLWRRSSQWTNLWIVTWDTNLISLQEQLLIMLQNHKGTLDLIFEN